MGRTPHVFDVRIRYVATPVLRTRVRAEAAVRRLLDAIEATQHVPTVDDPVDRRAEHRLGATCRFRGDVRDVQDLQASLG